MKNTKISKSVRLSEWIISICIFGFSILKIQHTIVALLGILIGILLMPPFYKWIEKLLHYKIIYPVKIVIIISLTGVIIPLEKGYQKRDAIYIEKGNAELAKEQLLKEKKDSTEKSRTDSIEYYIAECKRLTDKKQYKKAEKSLDLAYKISVTTNERNRINNEQVSLTTTVAQDLMKRGNYFNALPELTKAIEKSNGNADLYYQRAICNQKTNHIKEAVEDCRYSMNLGNEKADQLYEQINPVRKRVVGYITRCCDGTTSYAKGRGACSHHGGVCNWNEPEYEEYRAF